MQRISARLSSPRTLITLGLAIIFLSLAAMATRVYVRARDLQARISSIEALAQAGGNVDIKQIRDDLSAAKNDLADIHSDAGWLLPVAPLLGWLPQIGGDLAAAPDMLPMADALISAADIAFEAWSPLLELVGARDSQAAPATEAPITERLMVPLVGNRARFVQAQAYLDRAVADRSRINLTNLSPRMAALLKRVDRVQPLMRLAVEGGLALPQLLGASGPRTYLLIAQNQDEIRATGGFISAVGRLTLDQGKIVALDFMDSYQVDNLEKEYPPPPAPLQTYMLAGIWLFRDGNWSPDFPTAARQLMEFYQRGQGQAVDGVIALDQDMVRLIVGALGTIELNDSTATLVTTDNLINFMRASWAPAPGTDLGQWFQSRKNFIGALAKALQARVTNGAQLNWLGLARATYSGLRDRHLQVYVKDPVLAPSLARLGWDGALQPTDGDYLLVVDSNVGFNKAYALVKPSFHYDVVIAPDLGAHSTLTINYQLDGAPSGTACTQRVPDFAAGVTYDALIHDCFWNYLRLYTPAGSTLRDATRYPLPAARLLNRQAASGEPETLSGEAGHRVFASFFVVEPGRERTLRFVYDLPRNQVHSLGNGLWRYSLYWQKQPGTAASPAEVAVTLPPGAQLIRTDTSLDATPAVETLADGVRLTIPFGLSGDVEMEIVFQVQ